jgi:hypothetical protein
VAHFELKPLVAEVKRLDLKPDEALLIDFGKTIDKEAVSRVIAIMNQTLPKDSKFLILQGEALFQIVKADALSGYTWYDKLVEETAASAALMAQNAAIDFVFKRLDRLAAEKKRNVWWRKTLRKVSRSK